LAGGNERPDSAILRVKKELFRKSIHILGFSIPLVAIGAGILDAVLVIVSLAITYSVSEYLRLRGRNLPLFTTITKMAMRGDSSGEEQGTFVKAPLYFAAGILASLLVFPAPFNYAAIAVVTLGDGFSSVIGKMYGKNKIPYTGGKTVEGTATGLACAFVGAALFVSPTTALIAAGVGMAVELLPLRISDNLTVPLLSGLSVTAIGIP
jgi:dolichol kinase